MATDKLIKKDYLRHGEAVGLGILCEIFYSNKRIKIIFLYQTFCQNIICQIK